MGLLRKAAALSFADWALFARAHGALLVAHYLVRTRPQGRLVESGPAAAGSRGAGVDEASAAVAKRVGLAVDRAASYGVVRAKCLVRSVAIQRMLESRGVLGSQIRVGVRMKRGKFEAHAWVEYGDLVLGDQISHIRTFSDLTDVRVAPPT